MSILGQTTAGDPTADNSSVQPAPISGGIVSAAAPTAPVQTTPSQQPTQQQPAQGGSRLARIIQSVAQVADSALAGLPDKGRSTFVTGLGEGVRAEKQQEANQAAIRFKSFDDQVRLAQLHNQDQAVQNATQAQTDAHTAAELHLRQMANDMGVDYDTLPNHGPAVMDHLTASTATNGAASVPPGSHVSGDGDTIYIPQNTQKTRDGQKQMYNELAPALGLPALPEKAQFVPDKNTNYLTNKMLGYGLDGNPINHDQLPGVLAAEQTQRDNLAKNGATTNQLKALDNVIAIHKASLDALDSHAASVQDAASQRKQDEQTNLTQQKGEQTRSTNAQKPQKADTNLYEGTDANGNQVAGTSAELQAAGLQNFAKMPALTQTQTLAARELTSPDGLFATARNQIMALQQAGKLGPVASRWGNFWAQKGLDGDQQAFRGTLGLIATKLMQAHMGNRGGKDAMEHFAGLVPENSTPSALMAELNNEYQYVTGLSKRPKAVNNGQ